MRLGATRKVEIQMIQATKLSQIYDGAEDRILLIGEDAEAAACRLWLTQRMANQIVQALVSWLSRQSSAQFSPSDAVTVQAWEQAAAIGQYVSASPVQWPSDRPTTLREGLVQATDLQRAGENFRLVFHIKDDGPVAFPFSAIELRQWLSIIYGLYKNAGWPLEVWPAWFERPLETATPSIVN